MFVRPSISLHSDDGNSDIRTLLDLVEFHARHNPEHTFCIQARKADNNDERERGIISFVEITFSQLKEAILQCQTWLTETVQELQLPRRPHADQGVSKGPPIALLMDSNAGLVVHLLALTGLGVPVLLLSTPLSGPPSIICSARRGRKLFWSLRAYRIAQEALADSNVPSPTRYQPRPYDTFLNPSDMDIRGRDTRHLLHYVSEEDRDVLILHSSGTTGLPKPIYTSHRHYLGFALCHQFQGEDEMRALTLSTSPLFHVGCLLPPDGRIPEADVKNRALVYCLRASPWA